MPTPEWIVPMAATLTQERFTGPDWLFERKLDGIRLLAFKDGDDVRLLSRNKLPQHLPAVADIVRRLPAHELILDGEMTWGREGNAYHVFDLVWIDGDDLSERPLLERLQILDRLPLEAPLRRVSTITDDEPWTRACAEGWEGVIAKRRNAPYEHKRSKLWLKMKCEVSRSFVIGGFTDPQGVRVGLGALLVGFFDGTDFVFAGKVGTGFDAALLRELRAKLDALEIDKTPFSRAKGLPRIRMHWARPEIVVQVAFIEWTVHEKLRHSRLRSVLWDADPKAVTREPGPR